MNKPFLALLALLAIPPTAIAEGSWFSAKRIGGGPIIHPGNDPDDGQDNIMGADLVRVPNWVPNRKGKYYLYFGRHHDCLSIYVAVANDLKGPWEVLSKPVLIADQTVYHPKGNHITSPDVVFDPAKKQVIMLFHGRSKEKGHNQSVAISQDGLSFKGENRVLSERKSIGYLRVWPQGEGWLGIGKSGKFFRTDDLVEGEYSRAGKIKAENGIIRWRHGDVFQHEGQWYVVYSSGGDSPERIWVRRFEVDKNGMVVNPSEPRLLLKPEEDYEGADLPPVRSELGEAKTPQHAVRDPAIFVEPDGSIYMVYAVKGEFGIALAELIPVDLKSVN